MDFKKLVSIVLSFVICIALPQGIQAAETAPMQGVPQQQQQQPSKSVNAGMPAPQQSAAPTAPSSMQFMQGGPALSTASSSANAGAGGSAGTSGYPGSGSVSSSGPGTSGYPGSSGPGTNSTGNPSNPGGPSTQPPGLPTGNEPVFQLYQEKKDAENELKGVENQIDFLNRRIREIPTEIKRINGQIDVIDKAIAKIDAQLKPLEDQFNLIVKPRYDAAAAALRALGIAIDQHPAYVELVRAYRTLGQQIGSLKVDKGILQGKREDLVNKRQGLEGEKASRLLQLVDLQETRDDLIKQIAEIQKQIDQLLGR
jgi:predicted  nucleic acid-binding Zn-ribbon protein